ncbi:hypothetical protein G5T42_00835 [Microbacterium sp. 4R-513]|uniref:hypothetical protein n=1 Tax=Microbacterium sp. 4R-513 TaxID=2567934 RepID=UPI0013E117CE|nr:hypothetical protein [Microbacterium sp. 4R-513]QIG38201.1 hypothetical protein G5T42_00835 [Microbacterium sp. 4R-513]
MTPTPVSSTPILRTTLQWSAIVTAVLAVLAGVIGFLVAGTTGLWSALAGVLIAAVFLGITGASILIANRWYGDDLYVPIFFGIVLGGWILKFVIFIVALLILRGQPWIDPTVFFVSVVVSVLASLAVDVVVMLRMRIPHVSDVELPDDPEAGERSDHTSA